MGSQPLGVDPDEYTGWSRHRAAEAASGRRRGIIRASRDPEDTDMAVPVGFIGVGNMGNPMAGNVLKAGFPMTVFDKSPRATENLVAAGAKLGASARDVVDRSEVILTCLPASPDVEALYLEPGGLVESAK